MEQQRIAIQGYEGSFHQEAVQKFFGRQAQIVACDTFREAIRTGADKKISDGCVMAIENSIAGSILPNYNLLQKSKLKIAGEVYLQIRHNLLVNPGVTLEDIKEVHSHPMALLQCMDFLEKHNWKLVESADTATSAKLIQQKKSKHIAAVASKLAASLMGLEILAPNIHSLRNNYTRFLALLPPSDICIDPGSDKASVYFQTDHSHGSLARVLTHIADAGINLSKLQSFPIPGSDWKYSFHADMEFSTIKQFEETIETIKDITEYVEVYGVYKNGKNGK